MAEISDSVDATYTNELQRIAALLDVDGGQLIHAKSICPGYGFMLAKCAETKLLNDTEYLFVFLYQAASSMFYDLSPTPQIDVNTRDYESNSVLDYACIWGDLRAVRLLISAGVDVNSVGDMEVTPLHRAADGQFLDIVKLLLLHGAKETTDAFGRTPAVGAESIYKSRF